VPVSKTYASGSATSAAPFRKRRKNGSSISLRKYCAVFPWKLTGPRLSPSLECQPPWDQGPMTRALKMPGLFRSTAR